MYLHARMTSVLSTISASISVWSGDIGGQMGLFIGASILTILELFDYLYEVKCLLFSQIPTPSLFKEYKYAHNVYANVWRSIIIQFSQSAKWSFLQNVSFHSKMCFGRCDEQCVPCSPTHTLAYAPLSDTEYINILDVLYFKLVRMFQLFLIKVTCCCFFLPLGKQRAFLCFWICARVIVPTTQRGPKYSFSQKGGQVFGKQGCFGHRSFTVLFEA